MCHKTAKKTCNARLSLNRMSSVWYTTGVALLIPGNGKEVHTLETTVSLICSIAANVISYYICKWLEGQK